MDFNHSWKKIIICSRMEGIGEDCVKWNNLYSDKYCMYSFILTESRFYIKEYTRRESKRYLERESEPAVGGRCGQERKQEMNMAIVSNIIVWKCYKEGHHFVE